MKFKRNKSDPKKESCLELKYCERCGGLWLRRVGVARVYCEVCERVVAEMPPVCNEREGEGARMPRGPRWILDGEGLENVADYEGFGPDAIGGLA